MNVSQRGRDIQASPIRKLKPYADAAKAKGIKVFHLNIGDPDIPAPGPVMDTFHNWNQPVLGYGPAQGFLELREAVTRYFAKYDIPLGPDEVLITTGGSEAIHFTFSVIGDVGDEIIIPEPYYTNYNGYAAFAGLKIVPLPLVGRGRLPPAPGRGHRGPHHPQDQGHPALLAEQPHRHGLHARGARPGRRAGQEARPLPRRRRGLQGVHLRRPQAQEHPRVRGHQGPGRRRRQHLQALQLLRGPDRHDHHPQQGGLRGRPQVRPGPALPALGRADGRPGRLQHAHGVLRRRPGRIRQAPQRPLRRPQGHPRCRHPQAPGRLLRHRPPAGQGRRALRRLAPPGLLARRQDGHDRPGPGLLLDAQPGHGRGPHRLRRQRARPARSRPRLQGGAREVPGHPRLRAGASSERGAAGPAARPRSSWPSRVLVGAAVHFPLVKRFARGEFRETFFQAAEVPGDPSDHARRRRRTSGPDGDGGRPGCPGRAEALRRRATCPGPGTSPPPGTGSRSRPASWVLARERGPRRLLRGRRLPVEPGPGPAPARRGLPRHPRLRRRLGRVAGGRPARGEGGESGRKERAMVRNKAVLLVFRLVLGGLFVYAGAVKVVAPARFRPGHPQLPPGRPVALVHRGHRPALARDPGRGVPRRWASGSAAPRSSSRACLVFFIVLTAVTMLRGLDVDCGCFGSLSRKSGWGVILEDLGMLALGLVAALRQTR
ncbi:MAG: aminotransferase class I/II-fold pyridoxal phosphate-dependent enzyme [Ignavibacteriales bacterium]|nr:aminotransferase class I/II-fold pyridoxal phosphate-dependent enzyme [Ignavibacteriales bacterium]